MERAGQVVQQDISAGEMLDRFLDRPFGGPPIYTTLTGLGLGVFAKVAKHADMPGAALLETLAPFLILLGQRGMPQPMAEIMVPLTFIFFTYRLILL